VAIVLTLVQTKQIGINIHKGYNTKTQYKQYKTQQIQVHKLPKHPHIHTPTHYKTSSNNHSSRYTPNETVTTQTIPSV
jgi:hypothetical protein